jgi:hypothetical protein
MGCGDTELLLFYFGVCGFGGCGIWAQIGVFADLAIR